MKLIDDELTELSNRPLRFAIEPQGMKQVVVYDLTRNPHAAPGSETPIAQFSASASLNDYCLLTAARNEMKREVREIQNEIVLKNRRVHVLERVIKDTEAAMALESRSNEIVRALAASTDEDKAAVIAALLKKQDLSK
jgi:hypothetical protein